MTEEKQYQITYTYSGHAELVEEFDSLDEATKYFDEYLASGEEQPQDQMLVLEDQDGNVHKEHTFNEGNWESED